MLVGNYLCFASFVTSGDNFQKICLLVRRMNLNMVSSSSFFRAQKHYTLPVIRDFWKEIQKKQGRSQKLIAVPQNFVEFF